MACTGIHFKQVPSSSQLEELRIRSQSIWSFHFALCLSDLHKQRADSWHIAFGKCRAQ